MTKLGRPTKAKKNIMIKVRIDEPTKNKLEYCAGKIGLSKSEVIREGILIQYQQITKRENK